jgi:alpha-tubulin suppressor-like RCC1 family protein
VEIVVGEARVCALTANGQVYCWGGFNLTGGVPQLVNLPAVAMHIAAGSSHSCAVTIDGDAYCWGFNSASQLGSTNKTPIIESPVKVVVP